MIYYSLNFGRFIQPDTMVPNPGDPQSLNRYSYAGNNPLRYTDPSGHRFVEDNDANPCPNVIGGCQTVVNDGWIEKPDAELLGINVTASGDSIVTTGGVEILHNEHSGDDTLFVYFGASKGVGTGGGASVSAYYGVANGIGNDNLNYSGMFAITNITAADGIGGSASYSYNPLDNPLTPRLAHSKTMGPALGKQISMNVALVEYVPILTKHSDGTFEVNNNDYLFNPEFGNNRRGFVGLFYRYTPYGAPFYFTWSLTHAQ